jgi:molybdenum cofactor cytidylyltransferase
MPAAALRVNLRKEFAAVRNGAEPPRRLDASDIREDEAATRIAAAAAGANIATAIAFTGRANLFAEARGLLVVDRDRLDRLNLVDEAVTLGTLPPFAVVEPRQMVATVKIIPFAVPERVVEAAASFAVEGGPLLRVAAFVPRRAALIQTRLPGMKESILDKTRDVTEQRLTALGSVLLSEERCDYAATALAPRIAAAVAAGADDLEVEFVCIPRPVERSERPDGGPLAYRVSHRVKRWARGATPRLERVIIEGTPPLVVL